MKLFPLLVGTCCGLQIGVYLSAPRQNRLSASRLRSSLDDEEDESAPIDPLYGQGKVDAADEDRLAELVKKRMAEIGSGVEEPAPDYGDEGLSDEVTEELRKRLSALPKSEQAASDRRIIENIFEVAQEDVRNWGEEFREENRQRAAESSARFEEGLAEQTRAFAAQIDAVIGEAGIDLQKLTAKDDVEFDDYKIVAASSKASTPALTTRWPPSNAVASVLGDNELAAKTAEALKSDGYEVNGDKADMVVVCSGPPDFRNAESTLRRATDAVKPGGLVVVASRHGATRTSDFTFALRNARGDLTRALEFEDSTKLLTRRKGEGVSFAVVRLGDLGKKASGETKLELNDALDAPVSMAVAAEALKQTCLQPAARNQTLTVSGQNLPGSKRMWDDMFLKLDGPELVRLDAPRASSTLDVILWIREWATLWTGKETPLTTPVTLDNVDDGASLLFVDTKKSPKKRKQNGGIILVVDTSPSGAIRARAIRAPYDEGIAVKEMSENEIMLRFQKDFAKEWA